MVGDVGEDVEFWRGRESGKLGVDNELGEFSGEWESKFKKFNEI